MMKLRKLSSVATSDWDLRARIELLSPQRSLTWSWLTALPDIARSHPAELFTNLSLLGCFSGFPRLDVTEGINGELEILFCFIVKLAICAISYIIKINQ